MLRRTAALAAGLTFLSLAGVRATLADTASVPRPERGFPLIQSYSPSLPEAESQSFGIARDPRGVLYIANASGLLVHDGAWWQLLEIGEGRSAFSVASDASGRVGVGGTDDLGYLQADPTGALRFVSLRSLVPPGQRELGQVMQVHPTPRGFLYMTARWLLEWDGRSVRTLATFPGDRPYAASFAVEGTIHVWTREAGLGRLGSWMLRPVPGGELFRGRRIDLILPTGSAGELLVSVRGEGLFRFRDGRAEPFAPEASRWAAEHRLLAGCRLDDGRWVLGSVLGGVLLLRPDGAVDQVIDTEVGLSDDFVSGVTVDREGALWLALNNGLARVEVGSPLSAIDVRSGLKGSVYHVARHRGELWAATSAGLFRSAAGDNGPLRMREVPGLPPSAWSLLSMGDDLLVGTAFGLYGVRDGVPRVVTGTDPRTVYVLAPSADPDRVWAGMADGLAVVRRAGGRWRYEGMVEGVPRNVRALVERRGAVWCGTGLGGIVKVELPAAGPPVVRRIPASDHALPFLAGGRLVAAQRKRVLRLDEERSELVEDPALTGLGGRGEIDVLAEDAEGNLWLNARPLSVARRRLPGGGWDLRELAEVPVRTVVAIVPEPDGVVWLAGDAGLLRYEGSFQRTGKPLPAPRLARVTVGGKAISFGGAPVLGPDARRLRIELAPLSFRAGLRYQTRLDPLDAGWGAPASEPFAELTRLPPGSYTFRARTVGPGGETGPETSWSFRVLPPWYRTAWALVLGMVLALAGVRGYARLRSRTLSRRAAELEARVAAQTRELRRTLDELQRAHDELEVANDRLEELSLKDALTGVANRRRLQLVLEEEWGRSRRSRSPLAFALLDLDHFKLLNDTRGHREGDRCLQAVARFLSANLGRHSDLVARFGGEEFAVLLPETDLDGALLVAEQLRQGIEGLAIFHQPAPAGGVTASVGVASTIPAPGQRLEDLVEAADLALYRAKTDGRNRVCAATGVRQAGSKVATTGA